MSFLWEAAEDNPGATQVCGICLCIQLRGMWHYSNGVISTSQNIASQWLNMPLHTQRPLIHAPTNVFIMQWNKNLAWIKQWSSSFPAIHLYYFLKADAGLLNHKANYWHRVYYHLTSSDPHQASKKAKVVLLSNTLSAAKIRWKAFAGAQQQVTETLLMGLHPAVFILIFLGITTAFTIFRLKVFQKPGRRNNEDSRFL